MVQDNPPGPVPIFIPTEDHAFTPPLSGKRTTVIGVTTRTPTNQERQTCPYVVLLSEQEWDPKNVWFHDRDSRTVEGGFPGQLELF